MIPIWLIIGLTVLVYGVTIAVTGLVRWNHPANPVTAHLHADVWWGLIMAMIGLAYTLRFWRR